MLCQRMRAKSETSKVPATASSARAPPGPPTRPRFDSEDAESGAGEEFPSTVVDMFESLLMSYAFWLFLESINAGESLLSMRAQQTLVVSYRRYLLH
jgi:hypothetical protein